MPSQPRQSTLDRPAHGGYPDAGAPVLSVTMTRSAAEHFKAALTRGEYWLMPSYEPPLTARELERAEAADWLRWGRSRVELAEREGRADA